MVNLLRTWKVKAAYFQCSACLDGQVANSMVALCDQCGPANKIYDLIYMTKDYAEVLDPKTGSHYRVEIDRVYDIKEED